MNLKKVLPLVIALVLGGVAAKMAFDFVQKKQTASIEQPKRSQMVMAKRNIDAGSVISEDDLVLGDVAADAVPDTVFRTPEQLMGRVTVVPVVQGQAITSTLLAPKGTGPGLQAVIHPGMRAITMDINEITGVAGYIVPGSHVDVVQTLRDEKTGFPIAKTLVQNVIVLAVGQKHAPDQGDGGGHSITLSVTPPQSELLELASATGRPRFSLRSTNDLATAETRGVTLAELVGKTRAHDIEFASVDPATTQPSSLAAATTRPSNDDDDQWTVQVTRGASTSEVKFPLHRDNGDTTDIKFEMKPLQ